eukprot:g12558.t1
MGRILVERWLDKLGMARGVGSQPRRRYGQDYLWKDELTAGYGVAGSCYPPVKDSAPRDKAAKKATKIAAAPSAAAPSQEANHPDAKAHNKKRKPNVAHSAATPSQEANQPAAKAPNKKSETVKPANKKKLTAGGRLLAASQAKLQSSQSSAAASAATAAGALASGTQEGEYAASLHVQQQRSPTQQSRQVQQQLASLARLCEHTRNSVQGVVPANGADIQPEKAGAGDGAAKQPAAEKDGAGDGAAKQPAVEKDGAGDGACAAKQPAVEKDGAGAGDGAAKQPAVEKDGASDGAAKQPAVEKDGAGDGAAKQPAVEKDGAGDGAAKQPAVEKDGAGDGAAKQPAVEKDGAGDGAAKQPAVEKDGAGDGAAKQPAVEKDGAGDGAAKQPAAEKNDDQLLSVFFATVSFSGKDTKWQSILVPPYDCLTYKFPKDATKETKARMQQGMLIVYLPTVDAETLSYFALVDSMFWPDANTMFEVGSWVSLYGSNDKISSFPGVLVRPAPGNINKFEITGASLLIAREVDGKGREVNGSVKRRFKLQFVDLLFVNKVETEKLRADMILLVLVLVTQ